MSCVAQMHRALVSQCNGCAYTPVYVLGLRSPEAYTQPSTGLTNQNGHCQTHGCGWSPAEAQRAPWRGCYNDGGKREVCEEVSFGSDVVSLF